MDFGRQMDEPLDFNDTDSKPTLIRNAVIIDDKIIPAEYIDPNDAVTAYSHHVRIRKARFGKEFGMDGGKRAKTYSKAVAKALHHKTMLFPVKLIKP